MHTKSLHEFLSQHLVESSAPCRIDCGGTWDLRTFSLPYHFIDPCTVNIALGIRTQVKLLPFHPNWIKVTSKGFEEEEYPIRDAPFNTPLGLIFGISTYFGYSGVQIDIASESPPKSGLGGSGTVSVAVIGAFSKVRELSEGKSFDRAQIIKLAYLIEDGLSVSLTGLQDQAAAAFGGINRWDWKGFPNTTEFERDELIPQSKRDEFDRRFLVAYCGENHDSSKINTLWVKGFLGGTMREMWIEINSLARKLSGFLKNYQWEEAGRVLSRENDLRRVITPEVIVPVAGELIKEAERLGCGARFTGAGGGGCVWAIGEQDSIMKLRKGWQQKLRASSEGKVLDCKADFEGVKVSMKKLDRFSWKKETQGNESRR